MEADCRRLENRDGRYVGSLYSDGVLDIYARDLRSDSGFRFSKITSRCFRRVRFFVNILSVANWVVTRKKYFLGVNFLIRI